MDIINKIARQKETRLTMEKISSEEMRKSTSKK